MRCGRTLRGEVKHLSRKAVANLGRQRCPTGPTHSMNDGLLSKLNGKKGVRLRLKIRRGPGIAGGGPGVRVFQGSDP